MNTQRILLMVISLFAGISISSRDIGAPREKSRRLVEPRSDFLGNREGMS